LTSQPFDVRLKAHLKESGRNNPEKRQWLQRVRETVQIVALDQSESESEAAWLERLWIAVFRMCNAPLTNGTFGGLGLLFPTPETRVKLVQSHLGKPRSSEATAKQRAKVLGRPKPAGFDAGWSQMTPEARRHRVRGLAETGIVLEQKPKKNDLDLIVSESQIRQKPAPSSRSATLTHGRNCLLKNGDCAA
jgi:hypothetical protein